MQVVGKSPAPDKLTTVEYETPSFDSSINKEEVVDVLDLITKDNLSGAELKFTVLTSPVVSNFAPLLPEQANVEKIRIQRSVSPSCWGCIPSCSC